MLEHVFDMPEIANFRIYIMALLFLYTQETWLLKICSQHALYLIVSGSVVFVKSSPSFIWAIQFQISPREGDSNYVILLFFY